MCQIHLAYLPCFWMIDNLITKFYTIECCVAHVHKNTFVFIRYTYKCIFMLSLSFIHKVFIHIFSNINEENWLATTLVQTSVLVCLQCWCSDFLLLQVLFRIGTLNALDHFIKTYTMKNSVILFMVLVACISGSK